MRFKKYYNWIKYNLTPTSFLADNRLMSDKDAQARKTFGEEGNTYVSNVWSKNIKPMFGDFNIETIKKKIKNLIIFLLLLVYLNNYTSITISYLTDHLEYIIWRTADIMWLITTLIIFVLSIFFKKLVKIVGSWLYPKNDANSKIYNKDISKTKTLKNNNEITNYYKKVVYNNNKAMIKETLMKNISTKDNSNTILIKYLFKSVWLLNSLSTSLGQKNNELSEDYLYTTNLLTNKKKKLNRIEYWELSNNLSNVNVLNFENKLKTTKYINLNPNKYLNSLKIFRWVYKYSGINNQAIKDTSEWTKTNVETQQSLNSEKHNNYLTQGDRAFNDKKSNISYWFNMNKALTWALLRTKSISYFNTESLTTNKIKKNINIRNLNDSENTRKQLVLTDNNFKNKYKISSNSIENSNHSPMNFYNEIRLKWAYIINSTTLVNYKYVKYNLNSVKQDLPQTNVSSRSRLKNLIIKTKLIKK